MLRNSTLLFLIAINIAAQAAIPGGQFIYKRYGASDAYLAISQGQYDQAWHYCANKKSPVHRLLQTKILGDQGAYYLAANIWATLKDEIIALNDDHLSLEYFLLGADFKYQLYEFEQYISIVKDYSRHLKQTHPRDSLFYAIEASMKLKYFSGMIEPDSGTNYAIDALQIYRRNKLNETQFPVWIIYANQVSGCRNGMCQKTDHTPEMQDNFADTCLTLINRWYPGNMMEKLRIIQANDIRYLDRCGGTLDWINRPQSALINYNKLHKSYNSIRQQYQKLVGSRHGFISQISYLLALSNLYKRDIEKVIKELDLAELSNYSTYRRNAIFCLNWRRKLGLSKLESRVYRSEIQDASELQKAFKAIAILKQHEEIHYLRLLHGFINKGAREDDKYLENPFQQLQYYHLKAYQLNGNKKHLDEAWDYCQKAKYTDLNRKRLKDSNQLISQELLKLANIQLEKLRLMNDSLLLRSNAFKPFLFIEPKALESRMDRTFRKFRESVSTVKADDPVAGKYLHGKPSYTISKTQEQLGKNNSGRIEVSNLNYEDTLINMMWYISSDSVFCVINRLTDHEDYLLIRLAADYVKTTEDNWEKKSFLFYNKYLNKGFSFFRNKNISRINVSHDPNFGDFPFEIFATDTSSDSWLLHEFAFSYSLGEKPDKAKDKQITISDNKKVVFIIPDLPAHLTELNYAKTESDKFCNKYNLKIEKGRFTKKDLLDALGEYDIVQLFSHGEKTGEIWLSDGKVSSEEIRNAKSKAAFVSLTTCDSWHGKLYKNEGVGGMVEALDHAGTKQQLASFWKIDEKISVDIMLNFYENLFDGNPPDVSLREAKLNYLNQANKQEVSPIFWGGLAVFGDITPLIQPEQLPRNYQWLWALVPLMILGFLLRLGGKRGNNSLLKK
jgi:CHAT domain-containing protein